MRRSPNRLLGVVLGGFLVLVGFVGFTATSGVELLAAEGGLLLGVFELNGLHNIVHIVLGAALVMAGLSSTRAAKIVNSMVGFALLVLGLTSLYLIGTAANVLAVNAAENTVHFALAVILLAAGLGADRRSSPPEPAG